MEDAKPTSGDAGPAPAAGTPGRASSRPLASDVALMVTGKAVLLLAGVVTTVIVARVLGPGGRGTVAVAVGLALILRQLGTLGLTTANPYYLARQGASVARLKANSLWIAASLGLALALLGIAIRLVVPAALRGIPWTPLLIALSSIPFGLASLFLQSILLGIGRTVAYNVVEAGQEVIVAIAMAVVLLPLKLGSTAAVAVLSAGFVGSTAIYLFLLRAHECERWGPDLKVARKMVAYAFRIYAALVLAFLVLRVDLLLVNAYRGRAQAGIYSVDAAIAGGIYLLPSVIGLNLFVRVARGQTAALTAKVFRLLVIGYGGACLVTIPLVGPVVHLLYGPRFSEATSLYYWLVPGIFSLGMLTILANHFAGAGFPLQAMLVWVVGLVVNVVINVVLLPSQGTWVAAMSSTVAYTVILALHVRLVAPHVGGYRELVPRPSEAIQVAQGVANRAGLLWRHRPSAYKNRV
jgi:O-antigen/teichoic acid export membrane protein